MNDYHKQQISDWKSNNKDAIKKYNKEYYANNKNNSRYDYIPVKPEDRKKMRGRPPVSKKDKDGVSLITRGKREVRKLEAYVMERKLHGVMGIASPRSGRTLGSKNHPKKILQVEKTVGSFTLEF